MNLVTMGDHDKRVTEEQATQFMTLFVTSYKDCGVDRIEALLRTDFIAPGRRDNEKAEFQFQESLCHVQESDTLQSHIEVATHGKILYIHYVTTANPLIIHFDRSNTHFSLTTSYKYFGFCVNIGAPRSVI